MKKLSPELTILVEKYEKEEKRKARKWINQEWVWDQVFIEWMVEKFFEALKFMAKGAL
jgi:hypothetical protein